VKTLIITQDEDLKRIVSSFQTEENEELLIYDKSSKPLDVVGFIIENSPSILILDDDMINPDTFDVLSNIKKMKKDLKIIFVTSNTSIELGKEISPLGISYYAIKPLDENDFIELLNSLSKNKLKLNS
jgi:DNA-binding response OmpR family regulator